MSKLLLIFASLALIQVAVGLKCYFCLNQDCDKKETDYQQIDCKNPAQDNKIPVCALIHYKEKGTGKELTKRSCEIIPKDKPNECSVVNAEDIHCTTCTEDLCNLNSGNNFKLSAMAIVGMVLAYFVPKVIL